MTLKDFLRLDNADHITSAFIKWIGKRTPEQVLADCPDSNFLMLWALRVGVKHSRLIGCAGHIINLIRDKIEDAHVVTCIDAAIAYGENKISEKELWTIIFTARDIYASYAYDNSITYITYAFFRDFLNQPGCYFTAMDSITFRINEKEKFCLQSAETIRQMLGAEILKLTEPYLKMKNQVVEAMTPEHGAKIIEYWQNRGTNTSYFKGTQNKSGGFKRRYYGVIGGNFGVYTLTYVKKAKAEIIQIPGLSIDIF